MHIFILLISFYLFCVFYAAKIFLRKIWVCPDSLIYYTTDVYPPQSPYGKLFFSNFFICMHLFLSLRISSYSRSFVRIFSFLRESFLIYDHLWESILFSENFFWTLLICENLLLFMIIYENLFLFMIVCKNLLEHILAFYNLCENRQAYEHHHLRCIFHHQNMIIIFCWLYMFEFYVFYFEFFSFCVWLLFY